MQYTLAGKEGKMLNCICLLAGLRKITDNHLNLQHEKGPRTELT